MMTRTLTAAVLLIMLLMIALAASASYDSPYQQEPPYDYSTYETYVMTYEAPPATAQAGGGSPNDGRLNWAPDEYYTLYCAFDRLEVWRGVPSGALITTFDMGSLLVLDIGGTSSNGGVAVTRTTADIFTVSGANGNTAPNAGSKTFSLNDCIDHNGGAPQPPPPPQPAVNICTTDPMNVACFSSPQAYCQAHMTAGTSPLPGECTASAIDAIKAAAQSCCGIPIFGIALVPLLKRRKRKLQV